MRTALSKEKAATAAPEHAGQELQVASVKWSEVATGVSSRVPRLPGDITRESADAVTTSSRMTAGPALR